MLATSVAAFPPIVIAGFLSFGLIALLYLVTEELLVEAHAKPDSPLISALFIVGFLGLLLIEELMAELAAAGSMPPVTDQPHRANG